MEQERGTGSSERLYRRLSTEELQNKLRWETFSDQQPDETETELLLSELMRRGAVRPGRSAEAAWQEFQTEYAHLEPAYPHCAPTDARQTGDDRPEGGTPAKSADRKAAKGRRSRRTLMIVAATLAVLLAFALTAQASGVDVFGTIGRWTKELFSIGTATADPLVTDGKWPETALDPEREWASLREALDEYALSEISAPHWLPEGYAPDGVYVSEGNVWLDFTGIYRGEDGGCLLVHFRSCDEANFSTYEKLAQTPERLEAAGHLCYFIENADNAAVVWQTEHFECTISGAMERAQLVRMIESM